MKDRFYLSSHNFHVSPSTRQNSLLIHHIESLQHTMKSCLIKKEQEGYGPINKKVWFRLIQVREMPIILGDNPAVSDGVPITIDWKFQKESSVELDEFEFFRPERRRREHLQLSTKKRFELALAGGSDLSEIAKARIEVEKIQKLRVKAGQKNNWETLREGMERRMYPSKVPPVVKFTRVATRDPKIAACWENNGNPVKFMANAAA
jgi:hypothetical protein